MTDLDLKALPEIEGAVPAAEAVASYTTEATDLTAGLPASCPADRVLTCGTARKTVPQGERPRQALGPDGPTRQYHGLLWTEERVTELRAMLAAGKSRTEIAAALGVTRNAVCGKIDRIGLAEPRPRVRKPRPPRVRIRVEKRDIPRPKTPIKSTEPSPRRDLLRPIGKVLIWDLGQSSCRWPLFGGNEPVSEQFYCGGGVVLGAPYCGEHCARAFAPARRP